MKTGSLPGMQDSRPKVSGTLGKVLKLVYISGIHFSRLI